MLWGHAFAARLTFRLLSGTQQRLAFCCGGVLSLVWRTLFGSEVVWALLGPSLIAGYWFILFISAPLIAA